MSPSDSCLQWEWYRWMCKRVSRSFQIVVQLVSIAPLVFQIGLRCGAEWRSGSHGVLCPLSRFVYKVPCGLVILDCSGNWVIPRCFFHFYRLNPVCRRYGLLC